MSKQNAVQFSSIVAKKKALNWLQTNQLNKVGSKFSL